MHAFPDNFRSRKVACATGREGKIRNKRERERGREGGREGGKDDHQKGMVAKDTDVIGERQTAIVLSLKNHKIVTFPSAS